MMLINDFYSEHMQMDTVEKRNSLCSKVRCHRTSSTKPVSHPYLYSLTTLLRHYARHAEYLHAEVPGITIHEAVRACQYTTGEPGKKQYSTGYAETTCRGRQQGLGNVSPLLLPPRTDLVEELSKNLRSRYRLQRTPSYLYSHFSTLARATAQA